MGRKASKIIAVIMMCLILLSGCSPSTHRLWDISSKQDTIDFSHYPTAEVVTRFVEGLPALYPDLVKLEVIGHSVLGKPISALTITDFTTGTADHKPALLVFAQQHAREPIGSQLALSWVKQLLESFGTDEIITHLLATRTVYVVPQVNPDGNDVFLVEDNNLRGNLTPSDLDMDGQQDEDRKEGLGIGAYTKQLVYLKLNWAAGGDPFREGWNYLRDGDLVNAHFIRSLGFVDGTGAKIPQHDDDNDGEVNEDYYHGVDLNRNWDAAWLEGDARVSSFNYKGKEPWSEPETRALRDLALAHPNIMVTLDIHSGVNMILYPWSMTVERPVDEGILQELARAGTALTNTPQTMSGDGLYLGYGTAKDWLYQRGIISYTAEIYGASAVVSYHRIWPAHLYMVYSSTAYRFNPAPQGIAANNAKWQPYLNYLLAVLPTYSVSEAVAVNADTARVTFTNTGHLTPSYVRANAAGSSPTQLMPTEVNTYVYEFSLRNGESKEVTLELGSLLQIAERPLPPTSYRLTRNNNAITVEAGTVYKGPSPASMFDFGYVAPIDPWGQGEWFLTKP